MENFKKKEGKIISQAPLEMVDLIPSFSMPVSTSPIMLSHGIYNPLSNLFASLLVYLQVLLFFLQVLLCRVLFFIFESSVPITSDKYL